MVDTGQSRRRSSHLAPKNRLPVRPAPIQRRGIERVQAILDAAEMLLGTQGYEAASLKAVGARAGIPTASVYHYFNDRYEVDIELLRRHLSKLGEHVTAAVGNATQRTLPATVDVVTDAYLGYFRANPSLVQLWYVGRDTIASELEIAFDDSQAQRLWHFLVEQRLLPADTPEFVVRLAFEASDRLFDVAFRHSPTGDDAIINEARRMIVAYLTTYARADQD